MVRERPARCSRTFACSIANIGDRAKKSSIGWTPGPTPTIVHSTRLKVAAGVCMAVGVGRQDSLQQFLLEAVRNCLLGAVFNYFRFNFTLVHSAVRLSRRHLFLRDESYLQRPARLGNVRCPPAVATPSK